MELKNDIVGSLTKEINNSSEALKRELKKEKEARVLLAASLMKTGMEIPTSLLVGLSGIASDSDMKTVFVNALESNSLLETSYEDYRDLISSYESLGLMPVAAKVGNNSMLVRYAAAVDDVITSSKGTIVQASFHDDGKQIDVPIKVNEISDFIDILKQNETKVSEIIVVPIVGDDSANRVAGGL